MKVKDVPKYTVMDTVMQLSPRQRAILYRQCVGGRSCYINDVNYGSGAFFESCFQSDGHFRGEFLTTNYLIKEAKENENKK